LATVLPSREAEAFDCAAQFMRGDARVALGGVKVFVSEQLLDLAQIGAFLTIIIAAITSTFVARAEAEREAAGAADEDKTDERIEAALADLGARLDRVETMLARLTEP
jgi:hypothetical protein